jgi:hypothetical protein
MSKKKQGEVTAITPVERIKSKIYLIRGMKKILFSVLISLFVLSPSITHAVDCEVGYYKKNDTCKQAPANSEALGGEYFYCNSGYIQKEEACVPAQNDTQLVEELTKSFENLNKEIQNIELKREELKKDIEIYRGYSELFLLIFSVIFTVATALVFIFVVLRSFMPSNLSKEEILGRLLFSGVGVLLSVSLLLYAVGGERGLNTGQSFMSLSLGMLAFSIAVVAQRESSKDSVVLQE